MKKLFKKGDQGHEVKEIQTSLVEKGFLTNEEVNGVFDNETFLAVRSFQAQNLDQNGQPLVVWWRERLSGSKGHIGIVHQLRNGFLYTIEGNKSPDVQGFSYVFSRMEKLLGFGRVPD